MGNRAECPVCGAYGSDIYSDFENEKECRRCHTSYETILKLEEIESKKKYYKSQKISSEIVEENESLKKELLMLREKNRKLNDFCISIWSGLGGMKKELDEKLFKEEDDRT